MPEKDGLLLSMQNIRKQFPGVLALDDVKFDLKHGEVHTLIGENGAGKSTLIKILAGVYFKDSGSVIIEGENTDILNPHHAQELGIYTIFQEISTVPNLTIYENLFLGREHLKTTRLIDRDRQREEARELLRGFDYERDPDLMVGNLNVGELKMISIIKALNNEHLRILILDEPTSSLTDRESEILFNNIERLKEKDVGIIYISHRLEELKKIGDRVTVLRNGMYVDTLDLDDVDHIDDLTPLMIGKDIKQKFPKKKADIGEPLLKIENLSRQGYFSDVTVEARAGEVLGFFGLVGCGFEEVFRSVFGASPYDEGKVEIKFEGEFHPVEKYRPGSALELNMSYIPRDRRFEGLVLTMSVEENIALASYKKMSDNLFGYIDRDRLHADVTKYKEMMDIKTPSLQTVVENLSGGNQQKVVLAKALCHGGNVFLFCEPTSGIDVGTKVEIYNFMNQLTEEGAAIVLVSYELPEIMGMSDRIAVMYGGKIVKIFEREEAREDEILRYAFGSAEKQKTKGES